MYTFWFWIVTVMDYLVNFRITTQYNCSNNWWLCNLDSLWAKLVPSFFSKAYFPRGMLSSEKSEATNRSLKRRLCTTTDLCDFCNIFCDVVSEWMSKENGGDHKCSKGNMEMVFPSINISKHALLMHIIEAFLMFEKDFIDSATYNYKEVESSTCNRLFEVSGARSSLMVPHIITRK